MTDRQDEISTLNTLIATLIDSITGYEDAASNSEAGRFQQLFRERAGERQRVVEELRAGGEPDLEAQDVDARVDPAVDLRL